MTGNYFIVAKASAILLHENEIVKSQSTARPHHSHRPPLERLSQRFAAFLAWSGWVGVAFFGIYPTTNWIAGLHTRHYCFFMDSELKLPFVPEFIWLYLSMYVLFILPPFFLSLQELGRLAKELILATCLAGVVFWVFPGKLGFSRLLPDDPFYRAMFATLFEIDQPFNLAPSLHVVYSTSIALSLLARLNTFLGWLLSFWLALVIASTVFVHQHHLLDVVSGFGLAWFIHFHWREKHVQ